MNDGCMDNTMTYIRAYEIDDLDETRAPPQISLTTVMLASCCQIRHPWGYDWITLHYSEEGKTPKPGSHCGACILSPAYRA